MKPQNGAGNHQDVGLCWRDLIAAKNTLDQFVFACELRFARTAPTPADMEKIERQINGLASEIYLLARSDPPQYVPIVFPVAREAWAIRATLRELEGHPNPGEAFRSAWARHRSFRDASGGWDSRDPRAYALRTAQLAIEHNDDPTLFVYRDLVIDGSSMLTTAALAEVLVPPQYDPRVISQQKRTFNILSKPDDAAYIRELVKTKKHDLSHPDPMRLGESGPGKLAPPIGSIDRMVERMAAHQVDPRRARERIEARSRGLDRAVAPSIARGFDYEKLQRYLIKERVEKEWYDFFVLGKTKREIGETRYKRLQRAMSKLLGRDAYSLLPDDQSSDGFAASLNPNPSLYYGLSYRAEFFALIENISRMALRRPGPQEP